METWCIALARHFELSKTVIHEGLSLKQSRKAAMQVCNVLYLWLSGLCNLSFLEDILILILTLTSQRKNVENL